MEVTKTWEDENNRFGIRPDKITVNLYANGEFLQSQEITEADGWKYTFTELPKYDDYGELVDYTISEEKVEGYETTIKGTNIINTHHEELPIMLIAIIFVNCFRLIKLIRRKNSKK